MWVRRLLIFFNLMPCHLHVPALFMFRDDMVWSRAAFPIHISPNYDVLCEINRWFLEVAIWVCLSAHFEFYQSCLDRFWASIMCTSCCELFSKLILFSGLTSSYDSVLIISQSNRGNTSTLNMNMFIRVIMNLSSFEFLNQSELQGSHFRVISKHINLFDFFGLTLRCTIVSKLRSILIELLSFTE